MSNERGIAGKLLDAQAVKLDLAHPYTWASGWKSPIYCDNRKLLSFPAIRALVKSELCHIISEEFPAVSCLGAVATAGIAWGAMAADQLRLPLIYVRSAPKTHGMGNQIEGFFDDGMEVVVVEDLISTGKSSLEVVGALRSAGLRVTGLVSIFTYEFKESREAFEAEDLRLFSLSNYNMLIDVAIERGLVNSQERKTLAEWRDNPSSWRPETAH